MEEVRNTLLYEKALACLVGGNIGDAMGEPTEGKDYAAIEEEYGWLETFDSGGTDIPSCGTFSPIL